MDKRKEKIRKIYKNLKDIKLSDNLMPDDVGYKNAMIHAEWILNDFVPTRSGIIEE